MEEKSKLTEQTSHSAPKTESKSKLPANLITIAVVAGVALIILALILGGDKSNPTASDVEEEVINANCTVVECITKITTSDDVAKITEVIGVEPETDETSGASKWKLSSKESIVREKSGSSYILQATIDKTKLANPELDFSIFSTLKSELENGNSFTYDELVERLGGVEGTLAGKTDTSKRYIWVNNHDQTFSATFSDKTGECSIISLR